MAESAERPKDELVPSTLASGTSSLASREDSQPLEPERDVITITAIEGREAQAGTKADQVAERAGRILTLPPSLATDLVLRWRCECFIWEQGGREGQVLNSDPECIGRRELVRDRGAV